MEAIVACAVTNAQKQQEQQQLRKATVSTASGASPRFSSIGGSKRNQAGSQEELLAAGSIVELLAGKSSSGEGAESKTTLLTNTDQVHMEGKKEKQIRSGSGNWEQLSAEVQSPGNSIVIDAHRDQPSILCPELKRILVEVAKKGESSSLVWDPIKNRNMNDNSQAVPAKLKKRSMSVVTPLFQQPTTGAMGGNGSSTNSKASAGASAPVHKKLRTGLHGGRKTRCQQDRKRSFQLIRSGGGIITSLRSASRSVTTTTTTVTPQSPKKSSVATASRSASGSEQEDISYYDSEDTSNSEVSNEQQRLKFRHHSQHLKLGTMDTTARTAAGALPTRNNDTYHFSSLREALKAATAIVLDQWFEQKGEYKLSPAEIEIQKRTSDCSSKKLFQDRSQRLADRFDAFIGGEPPFTIQRIAEVLVSPEKYYTQTHKLCNCLERLLLVSSSTTAFGGSRGGETSQSRMEEQELSALACERDRIQAEFREARRRRDSLTSDASSSMGITCGVEGEQMVESSDKVILVDTKNQLLNEEVCLCDSLDAGIKQVAKTQSLSTIDPNNISSRREAETAARASLRNRFDSVGIDPYQQLGGLTQANVKTPSDSRVSSTNSTSLLPSLISTQDLSHGVLRSPSFSTADSTSLTRPPSPSLPKDIDLNPTTLQSQPPNAHNGTLNANPNVHLLQMHHAAAVAGVSPFDLMMLGTTGTPATAHGSALLSAKTTGLKEQDPESRSFASSDFDPEAGDVSFDDDSALDRSDGSDSGVLVVSEATAALGMAGVSCNFSVITQSMALRRQQRRSATANRSKTQVVSSNSNPTTDE